MMNPIDDRTIRAVVDARKESLANNRRRETVEVRKRDNDSGRLQRFRYAIGVRLMRTGARIAGAGLMDLPRLRPGV